MLLRPAAHTAAPLPRRPTAQRLVWLMTRWLLLGGSSGSAGARACPAQHALPHGVAADPPLAPAAINCTDADHACWGCQPRTLLSAWLSWTKHTRAHATNRDAGATFTGPKALQQCLTRMISSTMSRISAPLSFTPSSWKSCVCEADRQRQDAAACQTCISCLPQTICCAAVCRTTHLSDHVVHSLPQLLIVQCLQRGDAPAS